MTNPLRTQEALSIQTKLDTSCLSIFLLEPLEGGLKFSLSEKATKVWEIVLVLLKFT